MRGKMFRRAGILLPMTALPAASPAARHGEGVLGSEAYAFVDFLVSAGQSLWQILPVGPVGDSLSPYQSDSAFAGNPAYIDFKAVANNPTHYAADTPNYKRFVEENESWLDGFALFEAVRRSLGGKHLAVWPDELRNPTSKKLAELIGHHADEIAKVRYEQFCFFQQWYELKRYANLKGVSIIGDLPIYFCENSSDFWLRRDIFDVTEDGRPASLAGVPADGFSEDGQSWNTPVYDWNKRGGRVFAFWRERLRQAVHLYDGVRIDHFRAFADFYAMPVSGKEGEWRPGPGKAFAQMIKEEFPGLFVIAEDLGSLSYAAERFVAASGFPGMKLMQFAFSKEANNLHLPHNITENDVAYTGTHDNNTLLGWVRAASKNEISYAMNYFGLLHKDELFNAMRAAVFASTANTAVIPMQDWLHLGAAARFNTPGTIGGRNWKWRVKKEDLSDRLAKQIHYAMKTLYDR